MFLCTNDVFTCVLPAATTYSALGLGILTGKYNDGIPKNSRFTVAKYDALKKSALGGTRFG